MKLEAGETTLLTKAANIRKSMEYAGGKLTLTDRRLVVEPHNLNIDSHAVDIALANIATVEPFPMFGFIPTGVRLGLKDGTEQRLVVWGRAEVMAAIKKAAGIA
jgi:hypothetical protein